MESSAAYTGLVSIGTKERLCAFDHRHDLCCYHPLKYYGWGGVVVVMTVYAVGGVSRWSCRVSMWCLVDILLDYSCWSAVYVTWLYSRNCLERFFPLLLLLVMKVRRVTVFSVRLSVVTWLVWLLFVIWIRFVGLLMWVRWLRTRMFLVILWWIGRPLLLIRCRRCLLRRFEVFVV